MKFTYLLLSIVTLSYCSDLNANELYNEIHRNILQKAQEAQDRMMKKNPKRTFPSLISQINNYKENNFNPNLKISYLSYPTSLFKTCLYPFASENHVKYCNKQMSEEKRGSCLYSMCQVCCDNLPLMYKSAIQDLSLGKALNLSETDVSQVITLNVIHNCKRECNEVYPMPKLSK